MISSAHESSSAILEVLSALPSPGVAADVGSGTGRISDHLRSLGWQVEGCELDQQLALRAGVDHADVREWSPPNPVNLVTCIELIEHLTLKDQMPLLRSLRSWLMTDGLLVISSPQRHSPVALGDRMEARLKGVPYYWWDPTHISVLPRRRLETFLTAAGFEIQDRRGVCFTPDYLAARFNACNRLRYASSAGVMSRFGWDLIYTCRAV